MIKEFKPALKFLSFFLGVYVVGNLLYGVFIEYNYPMADPITGWVSDQSSLLINFLFDSQTNTKLGKTNPIVLISENVNTVLRIYEGCNGINVIIVFAAFVISFGGTSRWGAVFIVIGIAVIHLANLLRINLLFWVAKNYATYFYYVHKYIFTAALYVIVLLLWWVWAYRILKINTRDK